MHRPTVLVLSPSTGRGYFGEVLSGVAQSLAEQDGRMVIVQTLALGLHGENQGALPDFHLPVGWELADAAIAVVGAVPDLYLTSLQAAGVPVVTVSTRQGGDPTPCVMPDNEAGAAAAVEHLVAHGHRRIGFAGNFAQADIVARHRSYAAALAAHGLVPGEPYRIPDNEELGGTRAAEAFLADPARPSAILLATDRNALTFLHEVRAAGVRVPQDVAVVGFDDAEAAAFSRPPLTSVRQSFHDVGRRAGDLALSAARGRPVDGGDHLVPAQLVPRESCGCDADRPGQAPVPRSAGQVPAVTLAGALAMTPRLSRRAAQEHAQTLTTAFTEALGGSAQERRKALATLTCVLRDLELSPPALRGVVRLLHEQMPAQTSDAAAAAVARTLSTLEAGSFVAEHVASERDFADQFAVDTGLHGTDAPDPRSLAWLAPTRVRAAVLGLWEDGVEGGPVTVAGVHDADGRMPDLLGTSVSTHRFPPVELRQLAEPAQAEVCVVVPVRTPTRPWGLLALVARIETASARETFHHWATLLGAALDQRELQEGLHAFEQRYAAVARAMHEGLWEWNLESDSLYLSERCQELLGTDSAATSADAFDNVEAADRVRLRSALSEAMSARDNAVEVAVRVRTGDGDRWLQLRAVGLGHQDGPVQRLVGSVGDVDKRMRLEEQLRTAALYDPVTGLPNRRLFLERLEVAVRQHRRRPNRTFAVLFADLDGFKLVNDSLGHLAGDELLQVVGHRISRELREGDTAARFGGDEFAVLLHDADPDHLLAVADRLQRCIAAPQTLGGEEVAVGASIGITTSQTSHADAEDVLRQADIAMYHAKASDRRSAALFDESMTTTVTDHLRLRGQLRSALARREFLVHYQPIVPLHGGPTVQLEALVRWDHPDRGLLPPGAFLGALEEGPGVVELGAQVLDTVCAQIARWRERGHEVTVAVNVSHREFWGDGFVERVKDTLHRHGVPARYLVLEITETIVMTEVQSARAIMTRIRDLGVRLHVDDFGTGQSSLHALRSFPVDALKIDGSFCARLLDDPQTAELVAVIVQMGRALGLEVIAEWVETREQADLLQAMGCALAQGWLYSAAVPAEQAEALLGVRASLT
ncbi:EAL domain-containing protein [Isoptericola sp. b441]|uniref:EAL domain-containing protein n=1 Tax=Actinotalea lenta TaxID=3064654 RepID=A0ABT9DD07_9CELL|nr:EAL domain-containing protein [Isoptericola sp. b441]MDO8108083.1 EAL domain-containing protein [Isoptericola sp. b441]